MSLLTVPWVGLVAFARERTVASLFDGCLSVDSLLRALTRVRGSYMSSCVQEAEKWSNLFDNEEVMESQRMSLRFYLCLYLLLALGIFLVPKKWGGSSRRKVVLQQKDSQKGPSYSRMPRFGRKRIEQHDSSEALSLASRIKNETNGGEFDWKSRIHFFVLGAQKAGTTSIYKYMGQHPRIVPPVPKETRCWNHRYNSSDPYCERYFAKSWFRNKHPDYITGDFSPGYIYAQHVIPRVKKTYPRARFIVLLRDPIERAFSQYKMNIRNGKVAHNTTFESLCLSELEILREVGLLSHWTFPTEFYNSQALTESEMLGMYHLASMDSTKFVENFASPSMLESWSKLQANRQGTNNLRAGLYAFQLRGWMEAFSREQFLVVASDGMSRDTDGVMKRIHAHLGLSHVPLNDTKPLNTASAKAKQNMEIGDRTREILVKLFRPFDEMIAVVLKDDKWEQPWDH